MSDFSAFLQIFRDAFCSEGKATAVRSTQKRAFRRFLPPYEHSWASLCCRRYVQAKEKNENFLRVALAHQVVAAAAAMLHVLCNSAVSRMPIARGTNEAPRLQKNDGPSTRR